MTPLAPLSNLSEPIQPSGNRVPESHIGVGPEAFGSHIPEEAALRFAKSAEDIYRGWKEHGDQIAAEDAFLKVKQAADKHLYNEQDGALTTKTGLNTQGSWDNYDKAISPVIDDVSKNLSPGAKSHFGQKVAQLQELNFKTLNLHEGQQVAKASEENNKLILEGHVGEAASLAENGGDLATVADQLHQAQSSMMGQTINHMERSGQLQGDRTSPDFLAQNPALSEASHTPSSKAGLKAITAFIASNKLPEAQALYDQIQSGKSESGKALIPMNSDDQQAADKALKLAGNMDKGWKEALAIHDANPKANLQEWLNKSDSIADQDHRAEVRKNLAVLASQEDKAQKADEASTFKTVMQVIKPGQGVPPSMIATLSSMTPAHRNAIISFANKGINTSSPISMITKFLNLPMDELKNMTDQQFFTEYQSKASEPDAKWMAQDRADAQGGADKVGGKGHGGGPASLRLEYQHNTFRTAHLSNEKGQPALSEDDIKGQILLKEKFDQNWEAKKQQVGRNLTAKEAAELSSETNIQWLQEHPKAVQKEGFIKRALRTAPELVGGQEIGGQNGHYSQEDIAAAKKVKDNPANYSPERLKQAKSILGE